MVTILAVWSAATPALPTRTTRTENAGHSQVARAWGIALRLQGGRYVAGNTGPAYAALSNR